MGTGHRSRPYRLQPQLLVREYYRQTGRTTNMLREARLEVLKGNRVIVVMSSHGEVGAAKMTLAKLLGVQVATIRQIEFVVGHHPSALRPQLQGQQADVLFEDHFVGGEISCLKIQGPMCVQQYLILLSRR